MSLELLNKRLQYYGGKQQQRMANDKLRGLRRALLYSYQAATAILKDGKEFRCLINPDKNKPAYDNKILSIPYEDVCLNRPRKGKTADGIEKINIKTGDVFTWKETNTHWLVFLETLQEDAYFRSEIRRCDQQIKVNDKSYWAYIRGPVETDIEWTQKAGIEWNTLNYSIVVYITADKNTNEYFKRFQTVKIVDPRVGTQQTWQVQGVDPYYGDGILQVFLTEFFNNSVADAVAQQSDKTSLEIEPDPAGYISGPAQVPQYSKVYYEIINASDGKWFIKKQGQEKDLQYSLNILSLDIPGALGSFTLIYRREGFDDISFEVSVVPM